MATRLLIKVDSWCSVKYEVISYSLPSFCVCVCLCVCVYVCVCVWGWGGANKQVTAITQQMFITKLVHASWKLLLICRFSTVS